MDEGRTGHARSTRRRRFAKIISQRFVARERRRRSRTMIHLFFASPACKRQIMRFLGIGDNCDLGSLYRRLVEEGHEVKVFAGEPLAEGTLKGLVPRTPDWRGELDWVRAAAEDGVILVENVAEERGALQDALRRDGFNVIGGSAFGDRLENDRAFAQDTLASLGFPVARTIAFDDAEAGDRFLAENPGRYVLKFNGPGFAASDNYVGVLDDGRDVRAVLAAKLRRREEPASFVLMEHVAGVEMGVGAYFDGARFLDPPCLDWEHKRFFAGDMGELTGEMGTVVTYKRGRDFFARTLGRMAPLLAEHGHVGYLNLNTIVNARGIWPLEFAARFTYPGFMLLEPIQESSWSELFRIMTRRSVPRFAARPGFCVGIVLTTPPLPYTRKDVAEPVGLPVLFDGTLSAEDEANLHYGEVGIEDGALVTSGLYGWTMVATGVAGTIAAAKDKAYALADRVFVPNLRYRRDIGDKLIAGDFAKIEAMGLLDEA
jgi:phosphoribosylamine---glycine ligase